MRKSFDLEGDFESLRAAEAWCKTQGISVGSLDRIGPQGLLFGNYTIAKWHNLTKAERKALHGTLTASRTDPAVIQINPKEVWRLKPEPEPEADQTDVEIR